MLCCVSFRKPSFKTASDTIDRPIVVCAGFLKHRGHAQNTNQWGIKVKEEDCTFSRIYHTLGSCTLNNIVFHYYLKRVGNWANIYTQNLWQLNKTKGKPLQRDL